MSHGSNAYISILEEDGAVEILRPRVLVTNLGRQPMEQPTYTGPVCLGVAMSRTARDN